MIIKIFSHGQTGMGLTRGLEGLDKSAHIKMLPAESFENLIVKGLIHLGGTAEDP